MTKTKNTKTWVIALVAVLALGVGLNSNSIVQTVKAQVAAIKALTNPVTVYDDLYVAGSGTSEEPGDLMVEGKIYGWENGQQGDLTIESPLQVKGGLQVYGNTQLLVGTTSMESAVVAGGINVSGGDLNVANGKVKATSIGSFYRRTSTIFAVGSSDAEVQTNYSNGPLDLSVNCNSGDILSGCSADISGRDSRLQGANSVDITCYGRGKPMNVNTGLTVYATCFSPDGVIPPAPAPPVVQLSLPY